MQHFVSILNNFHCVKPCLWIKFLGEGRFPALAISSDSCSLTEKNQKIKLFMCFPPPPWKTPPHTHTSSSVTLDNSGLGTWITCACFWEINWNMHQGDIACPHCSSSLYQTICHMNQPESEFEFITHSRSSHGYSRCALNGFDFANDIDVVEDRCKVEKLPSLSPYTV